MTHPEPTEAMVARVRDSLGRQGLMATLGVELIAVVRGRVDLALRYDDRFTQQHGFLHAGAIDDRAVRPARHQRLSTSG